VKILIVKLSALGDVTHTLPALTTLRRHWPDAHLAWLVEDVASELLEGHPALDRRLVWHRREWRRLARSGRFLALAREAGRFLRGLRDTRYDLVIDFQGLLKSALWVCLSRGVRKAGYGPGLRRDEKAWLVLNERVTVANPDAHAVERNLRLLEGLGLPRLPVRYDLPAVSEHEAEAERLLAETGIPPGEPWVAINTVTRWPTKNWTADGFAAVADALAERGLRVLFTGAPGDRAALDAIAGLARHPLARVDGRTGLRTLAALGPFATLWRTLGRHFHDPRLRQLFGRYATYCGASPWGAPATLMLVAQVEMDGVWTVSGGGIAPRTSPGTWPVSARRRTGNKAAVHCGRSNRRGNPLPDRTLVPARSR